MKWELEDGSELEMHLTKQGLGKKDLEIVISKPYRGEDFSEVRDRLIEGKYYHRQQFRFQKTGFSPYRRVWMKSESSANDDIARESVLSTMKTYGCGKMPWNRDSIIGISRLRLRGRLDGEEYSLDFDLNLRIKRKDARSPVIYYWWGPEVYPCSWEIHTNPKVHENHPLMVREGRPDLPHVLESLEGIHELSFDLVLLNGYEPSDLYSQFRGGGKSRRWIDTIKRFSYKRGFLTVVKDDDYQYEGNLLKIKPPTLEDTIASYSLQEADIKEKIKQL